GSSRERLTKILSRALQDMITDLGRIRCLLESAPGSGIACFPGALASLSHVTQTPAALVEALASSAAASVMCHPAFESQTQSVDGGQSLLSTGSDDDCNDGYNRLVAEAYGLVLVALPSCEPGGIDDLFEEEKPGAAQQQADSEISGDGSGWVLTAEGQPSRRRTSPSCRLLRARDRSDLLLLVLTRVGETARQIHSILDVSCSMTADISGSLDRRKGGGHKKEFAEEVDLAVQYHRAMKSFTENVWELAASLSQSNGEDGEE
ncbi:unnamed protein product, partial [Sphacelaria rigidula]